MRYLSATGLSMSQAQSISNLCNQYAQEIKNLVDNINNASKTLVLDGVEYVETKGNKMPENIVELILRKGELHGCQAFLMEAIKEKDILLKSIKDEQYIPSLPEVEEEDAIEIKGKLLPEVDLKWAYDQLTSEELAELHEVEAYASHIGQFIHGDKKLDKLRKELATIKTLEWISVKDGAKTPLKVSVHHSSEELMALHEKLAGLHRKYEQRVNYFKAKLKNLETEENARIAKDNAVLIAEINALNEKQLADFLTAVEKRNSIINLERAEFEKQRQQKIAEVSKLRISVHPRFQKIVNELLKSMDSE